MRCQKCGHTDSKVLDSRQNQAASRIRRRRACESCQHRFTTYEVPETVEVLVLKKDGRREPLNRAKLVQGIERACAKRPVTYETIEEMAQRIEQELSEKMMREVPVSMLGEMVLGALRSVDPVAYVRFLSVYREYSSPEDFLLELRQIVSEKGPVPQGVSP